jgi:hypothetical protein
MLASLICLKLKFPKLQASFQISKSDATQFQSKRYPCTSFVSVFAFLSRRRASTYRIGKLLCRSKEQSLSSSSLVLPTNSLSPLPPPIYKLRPRHRCHTRWVHHWLQLIIRLLLSGYPCHHLPCTPCVYSRNRSMEPINKHLRWVRTHANYTVVYLCIQARSQTCTDKRW